VFVGRRHLQIPVDQPSDGVKKNVRDWQHLTVSHLGMAKRLSIFLLVSNEEVKVMMACSRRIRRLFTAGARPSCTIFQFTLVPDGAICDGRSCHSLAIRPY